jgi:hypothetical protein
MMPKVALASGGGGRASLIVLKSFFPLDSALLDDKLVAQKAAAPFPGETGKDLAAGESIGRATGVLVVAYAATDSINLTAPPANPGGPGSWTGVNPARGFYGGRTFMLVSVINSVQPHHRHLARGIQRSLGGDSGAFRWTDPGAIDDCSGLAQKAPTSMAWRPS